jgi:hypothetical protein
MPSHKHIGYCIEEDQVVLVFWSPEEELRRPGAQVQIIDVFAFQVVSGYGHDGHGRVRLEAQPAMGRLTRAAHLIRNDAIRIAGWDCSSTGAHGGCSGLVVG